MSKYVFQPLCDKVRKCLLYLDQYYIDKSTFISEFYHYALSSSIAVVILMMNLMFSFYQSITTIAIHIVDKSIFKFFYHIKTITVVQLQNLYIRGITNFYTLKKGDAYSLFSI